MPVTRFLSPLLTVLCDAGVGTLQTILPTGSLLSSANYGFVCVREREVLSVCGGGVCVRERESEREVLSTSNIFLLFFQF